MPRCFYESGVHPRCTRIHFRETGEGEDTALLDPKGREVDINFRRYHLDAILTVDTQLIGPCIDGTVWETR